MCHFNNFLNPFMGEIEMTLYIKENICKKTICTKKTIFIKIIWEYCPDHLNKTKGVSHKKDAEFSSACLVPHYCK